MSTASLAEASLQATGITVGYGGKPPVLENLDFQVPAGQFTAIVGPNGCGKSTLVKTLARTLTPSAGHVSLNGRSLDRYRSKQIARRVALLPQDPVVPDGVTVRGLVARGRHPYHSALRQWVAGDDGKIATAMAATDVTDLADQPVAGLSGGQRQRAWIAMILAQDTEYVLLDEPTSFLDLAHQIEVLTICRRMRDERRSVVAVLHDLNQAARYADQLVVLAGGNIVATGAPHNVLTAALVHEVFDLECEIFPDPQSGSPMVVPLAP
ncbi:Fe(3+)-dicitrate ABC transporter ATP-binding protein [Auritidibacter sp. NML120779]|nr:Fe(3+)-dicitrate ABC transporter ATP-binding protein [Auritidibacter sp. NML120779]